MIRHSNPYKITPSRSSPSSVQTTWYLGRYNHELYAFWIFFLQEHPLSDYSYSSFTSSSSSYNAESYLFLPSTPHMSYTFPVCPPPPPRGVLTCFGIFGLAGAN